jgi:hypothetical protein
MKAGYLKGFAVVLALSMGLPALAARADQRADNQQDRIEQGVRSGQLTRREARQLERRQAQIDREIARYRAMNRGRLTIAQQRKIDREQDQLSRDILRQKHDRQARR